MDDSKIYDGTKSINDLLDYHFLIPSYQRGYRWEKEQVFDLLEDLLEFHKKKKEEGEYYCLQPIVVTKDRATNKYIVVDGQQRLTTIHIIMTALSNFISILNKSPYSIQYETRPDSATFLAKIDLEKKEDNIDYYYMSNAYNTVTSWLNNHDTSLQFRWLNTVLASEEHNVRVIWYELEENADPIEVFTRLNMGKISLTNAELIKAVFLRSTKSMTEEQKHEFPHRQREIAEEWDRFELTLRQEDFWGFLQNNKISYDNHIELLFDLMADNLKSNGERRNKDQYYTFRFFSKEIDKADVQSGWDKWEEVKQLFQLLHDWFSDRTLYHLVGYLISTGSTINNLRKNAKGKTKHKFTEHIRQKVREIIPEDISSLTYEDDRKALKSTLLLFNILSILENPKANSRFQFGRYKAEDWDLEHIDSVTSEMPRSKTHQRDWLEEVLSFTNDEGLKEGISAYLSKSSNNKVFEEIYNTVLKTYRDKDDQEEGSMDIDDISNLTLLDASTNRGYKNAIFPIKRKTIIEKDKKGTFIPLCTKNVFLRYYTQDVTQQNLWGGKDRKDYKKAVIETIHNYLK
ncbi:DUF262 domain-containing protein [Phaeodactylibacter xiamenensis]|uniref:DUF262 domain-containing protein n=1 Tax=Phaeodactylibacter xiamenensis TaxID=1524460 RepID=UPI0024A91CE0|nr:DUF262 domain-containing protein [Phaeodactylibacter xiamenensis]